MRGGATDDDLAVEIQRAVGTKWAGHQINQVNFIRPKPHDEPDRWLTTMRRGRFGAGVAAVVVDRRRSSPRLPRGTRSRSSSGAAATASRRPAPRPVGGPHHRWLLDLPGEQRVEHRRSALVPLHPRQLEIIDHIQAVGATRCIPTSAATASTGSRSSSCRRTSRSSRSRTTAYGDESDPDRSRSRSTLPSRVARERRRPPCASCCEERTCELFELSAAFRDGAGGLAPPRRQVRTCSTGALRPIGWTSADAAGLPILPGLVRYDEVAAGEIRHAIRVDVLADAARVHPPGDSLRVEQLRIPTLPPMGLRLRLKSSYRHRRPDRPGEGDRHRDAALRLHRRRQRQQLVLPGRTRTPAGTTTSSTS